MASAFSPERTAVTGQTTSLSTVNLGLQSNTVVVLGAWNPAIVQPQWLLERKVVVAGSAENIAANPQTKGLFFQMDGVNWLIDEQRLQIWAPDKRDTGVYAARVLDLLPYTPIQAVGTNFFFQSSLRDWPREKLPQLGDWTLETAPKEFQFEQFLWGGTRRMAETSCQLNLTRAGETVSLNINLHRNVLDASRASEYAGRWANDWKCAREMVSQIFGLSVNE
jgi:hypothetical protein